MKVIADLSVVGLRPRPAQPPVRVLDFAGGSYAASGQSKSLGEVVSLSRASVGTRITSAGLVEQLAADQPRFTHGLNGSPLGLLIEAAATNLVKENSTTVGTWWQTTGGNLPLTTTTLRGLTAKSATRTNNTFCEASFPGGDIAVTPGAVMTMSFWVASPNGMQIKPAVRNVTAGTWIIGHSATDTTLAPTASGARHAFTFTVPGGCTSIACKFDYSSLGQSGQTIVFAGAQLEAGASASSTMVTAATTATRAVDQPGLIGLTGTHDVNLVYDDLSVQALTGVAISPGWWPAQLRPVLRSMTVV